jgi:hypothetical protein
MQRERTQRFTILAYEFWMVNLIQGRKSKFQIGMGRRRGKVMEQAGLRPKLSGKRIVAKMASLERRPLILDLQFWILGLAKGRHKSKIQNLKSDVAPKGFNLSGSGQSKRAHFLSARFYLAG